MNTHVRLLPVLAAVAIGVFAIKAISIAEAAGDSSEKKPDDAAVQEAYPAEDAEGVPDPVTSAEASDVPTGTCEVPDFLAEQAGLSKYEIQVLRSLAERRDQLDDRESVLDTRELTVSAAELRLNDQIDELQKLEGNIKGLLDKLDDKNNEQIADLVKVYESMKPKDAARIFDTLDNSLMLSLADKMKPASMAAILSNMSAERARTLTQLMAQKTEPPETVQELEARTHGP